MKKIIIGILTLFCLLSHLTAQERNTGKVEDDTRRYFIFPGKAVWYTDDGVTFVKEEKKEPMVLSTNDGVEYISYDKGISWTKSAKKLNVSDKTTNKSKIKLYPNPATSIVKLEYEAKSSSTSELLAINQAGMKLLLWRGELEKGLNTITFNVENISNGSYLLLLSTGEGFFNTKLNVAK